MPVASGQRITPIRVNSYLLNTPDGGYPVNANSVASETVGNRLTVPSATHDRQLTIMSHTLARYSQAGHRVSSRLYLGSTLVDMHDQHLTTLGVDESFKLSAQVVLAAGVTGVIEVRWLRLTGTGVVTTSAASTTTLSVIYRAA